ncbi:MAG: UMP kinase [Candidatus Bathyarchaeia archaeon]
MKIVIRIGGSVIASPPNPVLIQKHCEIIQNLRAQSHKLVVVVGGGSPARDFIKIAKDLGLTEQEQDEVAISVSKLFAQLLALKLGGLEWKSIPSSIEEAINILRKRGIVVMGGLKPGMTTDTVASLIASQIHSDLIIKATNQDGIYTKDPEKYLDAEKLDELSLDDLSNILEEKKHEAGIHQIIDPEAVRILKEKRIKTIVINGFKPENIIAAVKGEKIGTKIQ